MTSDNLLIIMSDEHQAACLGAAGHPVARTPHLDRLARDGVLFTRAYTPSPICVPARAAFATGEYVHRLRLWDNAMPYTGTPRGWGHVLQDHGVRVEAIGKLHYRSSDDPNGFDVEHLPMMVADGVGMVWASIRNPPRNDWGVRMLGEHVGAGESAYTRYDAAVTDRAIAWLREAADRSADAAAGPWCLYVGLVAPHFPLIAPPEFYGLYPPGSIPEPRLHPNRGYRRHPWVEQQNAFMDTEAQFRNADERAAAFRAYFGLVSWLDHNVGRILEVLRDTGLADTTTVLYTSDHGDNVGERGLWGKSNHYEESVRVPLILRGPGLAPGQCDTPASLIDVAPTVLDHFGLSDPDIEARPGSSLYAIASGPGDPKRTVFSEYHAAGSATGAFMLRVGRWKLIEYVGHSPELFDLEKDPGETTDLSNDPAHAGVLVDLSARLRMICDPLKIERQAHADQKHLVMQHGGPAKARFVGAPAATPPPRQDG